MRLFSSIVLGLVIVSSAVADTKPTNMTQLLCYSTHLTYDGKDVDMKLAYPNDKDRVTKYLIVGNLMLVKNKVYTHSRKGFYIFDKGQRLNYENKQLDHMMTVDGKVAIMLSRCIEEKLVAVSK